MRITVTFDSIEELFSTLNISKEEVLAGALHCDKSSTNVVGAPAAEEKKATPKEEAPKDEAPEEKAEPAPEINEDYRIEVRKVLAKLNGKAKENGGGKPAQDLIKSMGFERLTDVSLDKLPELMTKAKQALELMTKTKEAMDAAQ